ncbi:MAG: universal stress protein [Planctomycetes bacterium]|nr:universal stress protein [Planctomycetota bacterium]
MTAARIAVATDFSEAARRAFGPAASLARRFRSELYAVHLAQVPPAVIAPWPEIGPYLLPEEAFDDVEARLKEVVAGERAFEGLRVTPRVVRGEVVEALSDFLAEEAIDLLVVASHGHSGVKRFLLGSFVERILRSAPCPVLVMRADGGEAGTAAGGALGAAGGGISGAPGALPGDFAPRRILAPHDFSPSSRAALLQAGAWARAFGATARLLFVAEEGASLYGYAARMEGSFKEYLEKVQAQAMDRFRRILLEEWKGIDGDGGTVSGDPVEEILKDAASFGADLIVLGTHTRTGLARFFLGSVTQKTVQRSARPVLVVRGS